MERPSSVIQEAQSMDASDTFRGFREDFYLHEGTIYLDGNSLGLMSKAAEQAVINALAQWRDYAIDGWQRGEVPWFDLSERLASRVARLIGAEANEVVVTGSTTVNLHQILASFYHPTSRRHVILADNLTFPSDLYAIQSHVGLRGLHPASSVRLVESSDGQTLDEDDIIRQMTEDVSIVILPSVLYRSGQLLDMARLTTAAHARGILVAFDLCHSIGAIPHQLSEWGVDFAFWCHYKYLNAGPGGTAGLYVNRRHFGGAPGLAGWFSSDKTRQFDMATTPIFAGDAGAYQIGTPHILSCAPLVGSLDIVERAGIEAIRVKSLRLTDYLMSLVNARLTPHGFQMINPIDASRRGGHVALAHTEAARIAKALKDAGVIPDFRMPNIIRLAPVALYTSFEDVAEAILRLEDIMETHRFEQYENNRDVIA